MGNEGLPTKKEAYLTARLTYPGWSVRRVGEYIGVSQATAERYEADEAVRAAIEQEYRESREVLRRTRLKAAEKLAELLDCRKESIRFQAIKLILEGVAEKEEPSRKAEAPVDAKWSEEDWIRILREARGVPHEAV